MKPAPNPSSATPLVRLQRLGAGSGNQLLAKVEGNNPAGSVKDRPALSMVLRAEQRGRLRPGDTLIEATSGNTGIALAMVAATRGYRMLVVMPENMSEERRAVMRAFGAELVPTPAAGGMEQAIDTARALEAAGEWSRPGPVLQPRQPPRPLREHRPRDLAGHRWRRHALREHDGLHGHDHGDLALPEGAQPRRPGHRRPAGRGGPDPRDPALARGLPAGDLRALPGGPGDGRRAEGGGGDDPLPAAREGIFAGVSSGGRWRRRCASGPRSRGRSSSAWSATAATATFPPECSQRAESAG